MSSDVRSLLRQQRAARRIDHPHAAYSDTGKLLCTLCREQLKAESLWNAHLGSQMHKGRLQQQQREASRIEPSTPPAPGESSNGRAHKRKLDSTEAVEDVEMGDAARRKRGRPDTISLPGLPSDNGDGNSDATPTPEQLPRTGSDSNGNGNGKESTMTPPGLARKMSTTPSQGVELQIPSRPATPAHGHKDAASTTPSSGSYFALPSSTPAAAGPRESAAPATAKDASSSSLNAASAAPVDESEWAAFEADIAAATTTSYDQDAVISAPAMTSEEAVAAAAATQADDAARADRKSQVDVDIEDEREEARRALEEEFDQMRGLEERVGKLKEMRAAYLNEKNQMAGHGSELKSDMAGTSRSKETIQENRNGDDDDDDDEDGEDEDEDDEWDSFRFRR